MKDVRDAKRAGPDASSAGVIVVVVVIATTIGDATLSRTAPAVHAPPFRSVRVFVFRASHQWAQTTLTNGLSRWYPFLR